jgi:hypothetical protein
VADQLVVVVPPEYVKLVHSADEMLVGSVDATTSGILTTTPVPVPVPPAGGTHMPKYAPSAELVPNPAVLWSDTLSSVKSELAITRMPPFEVELLPTSLPKSVTGDADQRGSLRSVRTASPESGPVVGAVYQRGDPVKPGTEMGVGKHTGAAAARDDHAATPSTSSAAAVLTPKRAV